LNRAATAGMSSSGVANEIRAGTVPARVGYLYTNAR
jgi:hypothetical protein